MEEVGSTTRVSRGRWIYTGGWQIEPQKNYHGVSLRITVVRGVSTLDEAIKRWNGNQRRLFFASMPIVVVRYGPKWRRLFSSLKSSFGTSPFKGFSDVIRLTERAKKGDKALGDP